MITYTRTVAPASLPVSLDEFKANARIDTSTEDSILNVYLSAAVGAVEEMTNKRLITQTWERKSPGAAGKIMIERPPLIAVSSMSYQDENDEEQALSLSDFYVYQDQDMAWIEPKDKGDWPTFEDRQDALTITFTAGYGAAASDVPDELRQAILLLATHWEQSRIAVAETQKYPVPMAVDLLVGVHRKGWIAA